VLKTNWRILMPNIEQHVSFCVSDFGAENSELCYMVNSWMDAPIRTRGSYHRASRHNELTTPFEACSIYGRQEHGRNLQEHSNRARSGRCRLRVRLRLLQSQNLQKAKMMRLRRQDEPPPKSTWWCGGWGLNPCSPTATGLLKRCSSRLEQFAQF